MFYPGLRHIYSVGWPLLDRPERRRVLFLLPEDDYRTSCFCGREPFGHCWFCDSLMRSYVTDESAKRLEAAGARFLKRPREVYCRFSSRPPASPTHLCRADERCGHPAAAEKQCDVDTFQEPDRRGVTAVYIIMPNRGLRKADRTAIGFASDEGDKAGGLACAQCRRLRRPATARGAGWPSLLDRRMRRGRHASRQRYIR